MALYRSPETISKTWTKVVERYVTSGGRGACVKVFAIPRNRSSSTPIFLFNTFCGY